MSEEKKASILKKLPEDIYANLYDFLTARDVARLTQSSRYLRDEYDKLPCETKTRNGTLCASLSPDHICRGYCLKYSDAKAKTVPSWISTITKGFVKDPENVYDALFPEKKSQAISPHEFNPMPLILDHNGSEAFLVSGISLGEGRLAQQLREPELLPLQQLFVARLLEEKIFKGVKFGSIVFDVGQLDNLIHLWLLLDEENTVLIPYEVAGREDLPETSVEVPGQSRSLQHLPKGVEYSPSLILPYFQVKTL